jgi:cellulose synthase (UDP-forming)
LKVLVFYLVLTVVSIIWAFALDGGGRASQESSSIALLWGWYNIIILTLTCIVCIEQPRKRKAERIRSGELAGVCWKGETRWQPILDISTTGLRIEGSSPAGTDKPIRLQIGNAELEGLVVRARAGHFAVRINDTLEARKAMIRHVYGSRYNASVSEVQPKELVKAVLARTFR